MDSKAILSKFKPDRDNIINILHALQNNNPNNYLTKQDLQLVADYLNITQSSVYGVAKYYSMFSLHPRGKYVIRVCKSPLCKMLDDDSVLKHIKDVIGIGIGESTRDMLFTVEGAECLGHCEEAPVMMINDQVYTGLDAKKIKNILQQISQNK